MDKEIELHAETLREEELVNAAGDSFPYITPSQFSMILSWLSPVLLTILRAAEPSYAWSDVGANLTSLIYEWGEFLLHVSGKRETDPQAQMIELTLRVHHVNADEIRYHYLKAGMEANR